MQMVKEKNLPISETELMHEEPCNLILFNDDFNTFDFVIQSLIELCGHTVDQAETCAIITHYKGRCAVKSGTKNELKPIYNEFINRKLTAGIE